MKIGWLADNPGYTGGAEMTQAEFARAAPEGVEPVYCPPGDVGEFDHYVVHNCFYYDAEDMRPLESAKRVVKYVHDLWPDGRDRVRRWLLANSVVVFCSPLHQRAFRHEIPDWTVTKVIPPALDLKRFRPNRHTRRHGTRKGTCSVAQWRNPGKGAQLLGEWADANEPVDVYGPGGFQPIGTNIAAKGPLDFDFLPRALWSYETFVFLPFDLEPFCRTVVEAWAAGCRVITNDLVGARYYIEENPSALDTAADEFWRVVLE